MDKDKNNFELSHWLDIARRLQAISQNGLEFSNNPFDLDRYKSISDVVLYIYENHTNINSEYLKDIFAKEKGYATPKIDVRAVVFSNDKILMVREKSDNAWSLPGGWADVGQSASECVEREVMEESGYSVKAVKLLAVNDRDRQGHPKLPYYVYQIAFLCELIGGNPSTSNETSDVRFFAPDNLPELSLIRVTKKQIERYFELYKNPQLPVYFD
ncbi:MAG: NUDIX hydrolase [Cyanobacteriota bacterium]